MRHFILTFTLAVISCGANAGAQLDQAFADEGARIMQFDEPDITDVLLEGIVDKKGRYVSAGYAQSQLVTVGQITRHLSDGTRDQSFNGSGYMRFDKYMGVVTSVKWRSVVNQDSSLVVGGAFSGARAVVCRFNESGDLDEQGFGVNGCRIIAIEDELVLVDIAVMADGSIIVLLDGVDSRSYAVAKLTPDGDVDTTFGGGSCVNCGHVLSPSWMADKVYPVALAIDPVTDAIVLAANEAYFGHMLVIRMHSTGIVDDTFGQISGGGEIVNFSDTVGGYTTDEVVDLRVLSDNAIVVGGTATLGGEVNLVVARLTSGGVLDNSFGQGGRVSYKYPGVTSGTLTTFEAQPDGKLLLAGKYTYFEYDSGSIVMRLRSNGTPDESFGNGGTVLVNCGSCTSGFALERSSVRYDKGRIVVLDNLEYLAPTENEPDLVRYDPVIYRLSVDARIFSDSLE